MLKRFKVVAAVGAAISMIGLTAVTVLPSSAQEAPPPIRVELLSGRADFTDDVNLDLSYQLSGSAAQSLDVQDPSRTIVARITIQPGYVFPWHTHPGPVIVNVAKGKLVYVQASDCVKHSYKADTAFVDPGRGNVHSAYNAYYGETVLIATFFEVPASGPLTITEGIHAPADCHVLSSSGGGSH